MSAEEALDAEGGDGTDDAAAPQAEEDAQDPSGVEDAESAEEVSGDEPVGIGELVAELTSERDEYLDTLRRLQAEFDNYRKRTARQQADLLERAAETIIERLLPVLDALDLALAHVGERPEGTGGELEPAFVQIGSLLRDVLAKEGLERIDATGVGFDPTVHDAVAHVPADEPSDRDEDRDDVAIEATGPAVVETLRPGYRLKGRVLRPAMVKVRA